MTGQLRQKVTFRTLTATPDGQGGSYESWADSKSVFAKVERVSTVSGGKKAVLYNQMYEGEIYEVICRYDSVSSFDFGTSQITYDSKTLVIHETFQVKPEGTRRQQSDRYLGFICSVKNV